MFLQYFSAGVLYSSSRLIWTKPLQTEYWSLQIWNINNYKTLILQHTHTCMYTQARTHTHAHRVVELASISLMPITSLLVHTFPFKHTHTCFTVPVCVYEYITASASSPINRVYKWFWSVGDHMMGFTSTSAHRFLTLTPTSTLRGC